MSAERQMKVLANCEQGLTTEQKATARANIGAQGALTAGDNVSIVNDTISAVDTTYTAGPNIDIYNNIISTEKPRVTAGTNVSVNSVLDQQTRTITYTVSAADTTYNVFNTTTDGLVPKASGTGDTGKFLKGDGTWEAIDTTVNATGPLYGTGTQADPLILRTSHGLSLVSPANTGLTYLQVTHPVPAPGSTSAGKVLTCDDALENLSWQTPAAAPSIVQKKDYGDTSASTVATLLIDSDDPDGYAIVKCDGSNKGGLVVGPYKGLLDSGVAGVGDSSTPVYIDGNGHFATCSITGGKKKHTAELYFYNTDDGDHYHVRNIKNYCINHVAVQNHNSDICSVTIEAPTLGLDDEYDYVVVFDCSNSSGVCNASVQGCDCEIDTKWEVDPNATPIHTFAIDVTNTLVGFSGSPQYQIEVLGNRWHLHRF